MSASFETDPKTPRYRLQKIVSEVEKLYHMGVSTDPNIALSDFYLISNQINMLTRSLISAEVSFEGVVSDIQYSNDELQKFTNFNAVEYAPPIQKLVWFIARYMGAMEAAICAQVACNRGDYKTAAPLFENAIELLISVFHQLSMQPFGRKILDDFLPGVEMVRLIQHDNPEVHLSSYASMQLTETDTGHPLLCLYSKRMDCEIDLQLRTTKILGSRARRGEC